MCPGLVCFFLCLQTTTSSPQRREGHDSRERRGAELAFLPRDRVITAGRGRRGRGGGGGVSVPIPHKPALHDFPRSCGNSSHSELALGDLVSTMLLCALTPHRGVQALWLSSTKHYHAPPARASVPGDRAGICLLPEQGRVPSTAMVLRPISLV